MKVPVQGSTALSFITVIVQEILISVGKQRSPSANEQLEAEQ